MPRERSPETQLKELKREYRAVVTRLGEANSMLSHLRGSLIEAKKERDEWRARFDTLLGKMVRERDDD